jgi:predicted ATPase
MSASCSRCGKVLPSPGTPCPACSARAGAATEEIQRPYDPEFARELASDLAHDPLLLAIPKEVKVLGGVELIRRLGGGGSGAVYVGRHSALARDVAVKVLHPHLRDARHTERFLREAQISAAIDHPNIVRTLHAGFEHGLHFIVMEFVSGVSAAELLKRSGPLAEAEALRIVLDATEGLAEAHRAGIIHRDVKPDNILVPEGGSRAKLTDLGLARALGEGSSITELGTVVGTPAFMAPEQLDDLMKIGPEADVYAMGVTLFELVCGRRPFESPSLSALFRRILHEAPIDPLEARPGLSPAIRALILRALEKAPARRFRDGGELARALSQATAGIIPEPPSVSSVPSEPPRTITSLSPAPARTNLVLPATPFVGRAADLARVKHLFGEGMRLVTLWGPGGTGKTRLALHAGMQQLDAFAGGVWFCDLTEARTQDAISLALSSVLGAPLIGGRTSEDHVTQLGHALAGRGPALVILDNFEQVVAHAPKTVSRWLALAPEARFLVTSREVLKLGDEVAYAVGPLSLPEPGRELASSEAVQLFLARARTAGSELELGPDEEPVLAEVVRRLDGLPLAIELAAARLRVLSLAELLEHLERRFELLKGARRDVAERHATLRGAIDWSWSLLAEWERAVLAQMSVFRGGFSLAAARAVLDLTRFPEAPWTPDVVEALVEKSLVRSFEGHDLPGERRFGLLESVREYAQEKLAHDAVAQEAALRRHAAYHLEAGTRWSQLVDGPGGRVAFRRLVRERENLEAVHERAVARTPPTPDSAREALEAALALAPLAIARGPIPAHLAVLDAALEHARAVEIDRGLRARALLARARGRRTRGFMPEAAKDTDEVSALAEALGDRALRGAALRERGALALVTGRVDVAVAELERARALLVEAGDRAGAADALNTLGVARRASNIDAALELFERALVESRALGDRRLEGMALANVATTYFVKGDGPKFRTISEEALRAFRETGDLRSEATLLGNLGSFLRGERNFDKARATLERALDLYRLVGERGAESRFVSALASVALDLGDPIEARALYEQSLAVSREVGQKGNEAISLSALAGVDQIEGKLDVARARLDEAIAIYRSLGDRLNEGEALVAIGACEFTRGNDRIASTVLSEALGQMQESWAAITRFTATTWLGAAHARLGEIGAAESAFGNAGTLVPHQNDPAQLDLLEHLRGFLDLARAREASRAGRASEVAAHLEAARARVARGSASAAETRHARKLLENEIERTKLEGLS